MTLVLSVVFTPINVVNAKIDGCKNVGYSEYEILVKMSYESYSIRYGDPLGSIATTQTDNFSKEVVIPGTGDKQKDLENVIKIVKETTTDKGNKFRGTNIVTPEWNNPDQVYEIREVIKTHENFRP